MNESIASQNLREWTHIHLIFRISNIIRYVLKTMNEIPIFFIKTRSELLIFFQAL